MAERRALVTGANRGIGRAIAGALASEGLAVVLAGRDEQAVEEAVAGIRANGGRLVDATAVQLDVTDPASVERAAQAVGAIDVLINNAAILDEGEDPLAQTDERIAELIDTNLHGAWRTTRAFAPNMVDNGWGRIVNVSSGAGSFEYGLWPVAPAYSVSKAALNALTVVLAARFNGTGVKVNAVDPGTVGTRMAPYASRTPEQAAEHVAHLALLPDDGPSGDFFHEGRPIPW